ncbi:MULTISPECIES: cupin domain-containing protein [Streptomyces]|uniref:cupin domain-containing protein n=1 Tax=Streptomyces TaxID=1883 RepID=UPI001C2EACB4|nr:MULTISPECIES: cupin domain-containing protein [Streptomyces]MBV1950451.1 cupin domain-containing protein [Streptomyces sp. BV129]BDH06601.1 cupin [Streptomyces seoulensis]
MPQNDEPAPGHRSEAWKTAVTVVGEAQPPAFPDGARVITARVEFPPGDPGTPPHRHSGPVFGYVVEGEMLYELEGEPPRVIRAGEAFWEPGGDVIHYQDANHRTDIPLRFLATLVCEPDKPLLELVGEQELAEREHRRAPRPS